MTKLVSILGRNQNGGLEEYVKCKCSKGTTKSNSDEIPYTLEIKDCYNWSAHIRTPNFTFVKTLRGLFSATRRHYDFLKEHTSRYIYYTLKYLIRRFQ